MPFKPGYDANRYSTPGLAEWRQEVSETIKEHIPECVEFILTTMRNDKAAPKLRLVAAQELLNRGLGKPVDTTMLITMDPSEDTRDVSTLTDTQLESLVRNQVKQDQNNQAIEAEYTEVSNDGV